MKNTRQTLPVKPFEWQKYLLPNREMNVEHPLVQSVAKEITHKSTDETEKVIRIFYFVRDDIPYNMYPKDTAYENYRASAVLENGEGWCLQKSLLAATLCRAVGVPARICFAEVVNHALGKKAYEAIGTNHFSPHTYAEVYLNQKWLPITPVFDAPLCTRLQVPTVEFDGAHPAMLSPVDLKGDPYMEYVSKTPGYDKLPWNFILDEIKRVYKEKAAIWFSENLLQENSSMDKKGNQFFP